MKNKKGYILLALLMIGALVYFIYPTGESIYVGTIEVTEVDVAPRVHGQISARLVDEGDFVKAGQLMYKISCENYLVENVKATNDYERARKLLANGNLSPEQYDTYKRNYDLSQLNVGWCDVLSPMDGVVLTKFHEAGDHVNVGTKLMAMGDLVNDVWAYIYVDQPMLVKLSIGEDVIGVLPELNSKQIKGKIIRIKDEAEFTPKNVQTRHERTRLVYGIKIKFDNSENLLKPGMPIEVRFKK